jgi:hypothetical protein
MSDTSSLPPREGGAALIEARLGRAPQDMLEAAVALEAWAGMPAQRALHTGAALMPSTPLAPERSAADLPPLVRRPELLLEGLAFIVSVLAIALWAAPLVEALGTAAVTRALTLALPLTLALQWGLRSRYLSHPRGLAELSRARGDLALLAVALTGVPWAVLGRAGAVAGLLTVTWTGGTVLIRRGWGAVYVAIVLGATPAMIAGAPPLLVLAPTAVATAAAVAAALRPRGDAERPAAGRWSRAAACALLGAGLGAMLVADPSVGWSTGAAPALALLPSAVAGVWGGHRLWRLEPAIPRALAGIAAVAPEALNPQERPGADRRRRASLGRLRSSPAWVPVTTLTGAIARVGGAAAVGSVVVAALVPVTAGLLTAFALLALATLLVSLLEALGGVRWAGVGVACGLAVELAGAGLAIGAAVSVLVLLPGAIAPLLRPARTLATTLWIA